MLDMKIFALKCPKHAQNLVAVDTGSPAPPATSNIEVRAVKGHQTCMFSIFASPALFASAFVHVGQLPHMPAVAVDINAGPYQHDAGL